MYVYIYIYIYSIDYWTQRGCITSKLGIDFQWSGSCNRIWLAGSWHNAKIINWWPFAFKIVSNSRASVDICFVLWTVRVSATLNAGLRLSQPSSQSGRLLHFTPSRVQENLSTEQYFLSQITLSLLTKTVSFWEIYDIFRNLNIPFVNLCDLETLERWKIPPNTN